MTLNLRYQLKFYMKKRGIAAHQLAKDLCIPKSTIADWLLGSVPRDLIKLKKTAQYFNIGLDHLLFGTGDLNGEADKEHGNLVETHRLDIQAGLYEVVLRPIRK